MWATFADLAEPHAIVIDGVIAGSFSIDDEHQLHALHVTSDLQQHAADALALVVESKGVAAMIASTMDPGFLSLSLTHGAVAEPIALVYEHTADVPDRHRAELRPAYSVDHARAADFMVTATGSPAAFLDSYLAERIGKVELFVMENEAGRIVAVGESRLDPRNPGHTHLGVVVGSAVRGGGIGTRIMTTLVQDAREQNLVPHCSTEPSNLAAQRAIHRAGFRTCHSIFRIPTMQRPAD